MKLLSKKILFINGGLAGDKGNTFELLNKAKVLLERKCELEWCNLEKERDYDQRLKKCLDADGFVFGTGTYWDSWSSILQDFFEQMTKTEGSEIWLGKPTSVLVTMHSVGGKSVLSRLQATLNLFGLLIPPMSGMVYSALSHEVQNKSNMQTEAWCLEDLEVVCHNLIESISGGSNWKNWLVDDICFKQIWMKEK